MSEEKEGRPSKIMNAISAVLLSKDEQIKSLESRLKEAREIIQSHEDMLLPALKAERLSLEQRLSQAEAERAKEQIVNCCAYQSFRGQICNKCGKYNMTFKEEIQSTEARLSNLMDVAGKMAGALEKLVYQYGEAWDEYAYWYNAKKSLSDFRALKEEK